jgi:signal transduction histidine kinase
VNAQGLASELEYEALLNALPVATCVQKEAQIQWANRPFQQLWPEGLSPGADLASLALGADEKGRLREFLSSSVIGSRGVFRFAAGETVLEVEFEVGARLCWRNHEVTPLFAYDVTQKREHQEKALLSARMASLGTVAASVAHELNNPLAFVLAQVELAQKSAGSGQMPADSLETIREGLERLRGVVGDLRAFSKGDTDSVKTVDVRAVLGRVLRMADKSLLSRALLIEDFEPVSPVLGNEGRLSQVFLNLLINAAEALPDDSSQQHRIRIRTRTAVDERVEVAIADTGVGIDEAHRSRIFESFFTTKGARSGTGLGLAICRRIVLEHGGQVFARTSEDGLEPPYQTELVTLLPTAPVREVNAPTSPRAVAVPRRRVLLVDDEPRLLRTLGGLLAQTHDVSTAESGERALQVLRAGDSFDVIVCDMMMQGMDGAGLYEMISKLFPGLERRMIFMTGGAFTKKARSFLQEIPNSRLDKPFELETLIDAIEKVSR